MASGAKAYVFKVTHDYVVDPESVEQGHRVWAMYLAERLRRNEKQGRSKPRPESSA